MVTHMLYYSTKQWNRTSIGFYCLCKAFDLPSHWLAFCVVLINTRERCRGLAGKTPWLISPVSFGQSVLHPASPSKMLREIPQAVYCWRMSSRSTYWFRWQKEPPGQTFSNTSNEALRHFTFLEIVICLITSGQPSVGDRSTRKWCLSGHACIQRDSCSCSD